MNKTADITRGSVQKSVCVLSRLPLYGQIQVKMALITEAYFAEGDFERVDLIHQTYDNLNACLSDDMLHTQQESVLNSRAPHFRNAKKDERTIHSIGGGRHQTILQIQIWVWD